MATSYQRIALSDSIGLHQIIDPKFKTNTLKVRFLLPLHPAHAAAHALAGSLLTTSCPKYPSLAALSKKVNLLYGASLFLALSKQGDLQSITVSGSTIANPFALEQEDLMGELLQLVLDCIFHPHAEHGAFCQPEFQIKQKDLLDTIEAENNNERDYTLMQTCKTAFQSEPAAYSCYGTKEDALAVTPESAFAAYQTMLQTAAVEVFFVGPAPDPRIQPALEAAFAAMDRTKIQPIAFFSASPIKPEPVTITEKLPVHQSKLALAFKLQQVDPYAMKLMNLLYGQTPFSQLFLNVRYKKSLCYYCTSTYLETKQTLLVDCGVEAENMEAAQQEILLQLQEMQAGHFTDEELEHAKYSAYNTLKGIGDTPASYIKWYFSQFCHHTDRSLEEELQCYQAVTREDILQAANSCVLDTIYHMEQED